MNIQMLTLTVLAGLMALTSGQIISHDACPENIKVVESFNVTKYLGKWYEYAKYPVYFEAAGKCITTEYTLNKDGNINVKNALVSEINNAYSDVLGTASLVSPGKLLVQLPVLMDVNVSSNYWVLDTDYDNYAVVYSCVPLPDNITATNVWIITREPLPQPSFIEKAVSVLKNNDISLFKLKITNQISCN